MPTCQICDTRKPKRYCTSRGENICTQCCATEREVSINCPMECIYLQESRAHAKLALDASTMPHREVQIDDRFLQHADVTLILFSAFFSRAAMPIPNATDAEMRAAIEAVIQRFKGNPAPPEEAVALKIYDAFCAEYDKFRAEITKDQKAESVFSDETFVRVLVFIARVAHGHNNGRPLCRAFLHYLRATLPPNMEASVG